MNFSVDFDYDLGYRINRRVGTGPVVNNDVVTLHIHGNLREQDGNRLSGGNLFSSEETGNQVISAPSACAKWYTDSAE